MIKNKWHARICECKRFYTKLAENELFNSTRTMNTKPHKISNKGGEFSLGGEFCLIEAINSVYIYESATKIKKVREV